MKISSSYEDYLEFIYKNLEKNENIKAVDISKKFNISRASVTEALQKLEQKGYIIYGRYQPIQMTDAGKILAKEIITKHEALCKFFVHSLSLSEKEASINACKIEHIITPAAFEQIQNYVKNNKL